MHQLHKSQSLAFLNYEKTMKSFIQQSEITSIYNSNKKYAATQNDIQYQICSTFFKNTGFQVIHKQLQMMQESNQLLEKLQSKLFKNNQKQQSVELSMTKDVTIFNQDQSFLGIDQRSHHPLKKVLSRTKLHNNATRRVVSYLSTALRQIEDNCSQKTYTFINNIIQEHKKLLQFKGQSEKKDTAFTRAKDRIEKIQQQNLILKNKNKDFEIQIKKLQETIQSIKKSKGLISATSLSRVSSVSCLSNQQSYSKKLPLRGQINERFQKHKTMIDYYLSEKQAILNQKVSSLKQIDNKIILVLINQNGQFQKCQRCCNMMKKLKQSIMKYKVYMQSQMQATDAFYEKFKQSFSKEN